MILQSFLTVSSCRTLLVMIEVGFFFYCWPNGRPKERRFKCLKQYIHTMWNFVSFIGSSKDNGHVPENRIPERKLLDAEAAYMKIMVMCSHNRKEEGKK